MLGSPLDVHATNARRASRDVIRTARGTRLSAEIGKCAFAFDYLTAAERALGRFLAENRASGGALTGRLNLVEEAGARARKAFFQHCVVRSR